MVKQYKLVWIQLCFRSTGSCKLTFYGFNGL